MLEEDSVYETFWKKETNLACVIPLLAVLVQLRLKILPFLSSNSLGARSLCSSWVTEKEAKRACLQANKARAQQGHWQEDFKSCLCVVLYVLACSKSVSRSWETREWRSLWIFYSRKYSRFFLPVRF